MANLYINTTQNIRLFFTPASLGERMLAFIIDSLIKIAYIIFVYFVFGRLFQHTESIYTIFLLFSLPFIFYSLVCESTMEGQTFGKKLMKIKVIKIDGYQASFMDYFIRWIFAFVDVQMMAIPGIVTMIINKHTRRLGDLAAGTAVISEKEKFDLSHTLLLDIHEDYEPHFSRTQIMRFSDNDMRIIKENAATAKKNKNQILIAKLSEKILAVLQTTNPFATDFLLIDTLLKDYNHYTGNSRVM